MQIQGTKFNAKTLSDLLDLMLGCKRGKCHCVLTNVDLNVITDWMNRDDN